MAFNPNPGRNEYTATAGQTLFTFNFKAYNTSDILVYQTPSGQAPDDTNDILTNVIDYTVVINGDSGGTVTLISPATLNDSITFVRDLPVTRSIEYQRLGDMSAQTINLDQDYQTYLILDQENRANRHMALPESAQNVSSEIPSPVPLNFFQWNAAGDAIVNVNSLQADGYVWTAAEIYTQTESDALFTAQTDFDDKSKLWDAQTTTHDFTTDADYTLTAAQNLYGRIILTDTGVVLTVARSVITDNIEKSFTVQNDTAQDITVKTLAGTGILVPTGAYANLYNDGTSVVSIDNKFGMLNTDNMIHIQDQKASGTDGGTFTSGSYVTRVLNTVLTNTISGASLSSNQISLPAGEYLVRASAPSYKTSLNKTKIYNVTDASDILIGTSELTGAADATVTKSFVNGIFTLADAKIIELQHRCTATQSTNGLGYATSFGDIEVYADIEIWKVD